jgi:hypothetical protein
MQSTSHVVAIVGGVITLLLIATVVRAVTRRLKLPFTVVLVLIGIGLAALSAAYPHGLSVLHNLEISSALIFYVFLPTLTFEAAFNLDARQLHENLGSVLVLAGPGLLLSTLLIGLQTLQIQIDAVRNRSAYQDVPPHRSALQRLEGAALRWIHRVALLASVAERLHWHRIVMDYEMAGARFQSSRRVLDMLDTLARVAATPRCIVDMLRRQYQHQYETA